MRVIGIDFGTTTCSVAWWLGNVGEKPTLVVLNKKSKTYPNIIKSEVKLSNGKQLSNFKLAIDKSGRGEAVLTRIETVCLWQNKNTANGKLKVQQ